jgi:hypothetical protein
MPWGAAAAIGGALIGASATSSAADKAAAAQQAATDANAYQGEIAKSQYEEYQKIYQPLEEQMVADATNYDSQESYDKAAAAAQASVNSQISAAKSRLQRTPGMDPSSAAAVTATTDMDLKGAALGASEQNKARENIANQAYARKQDAVALGKGLVSTASSGLASAAAGATASANAATASANQTASGIGALASSAITAAGKADWSKLTNLFSSSDTATA